jgi:hypothetical protein
MEHESLIISLTFEFTFFFFNLINQNNIVSNSLKKVKV